MQNVWITLTQNNSHVWMISFLQLQNGKEETKGVFVEFKEKYQFRPFQTEPEYSIPEGDID